MQTFSANFCRCVVLHSPAWEALLPKTVDRAKQYMNLHGPLLAISGSTPTDIELWSIQVQLVGLTGIHIQRGLHIERGVKQGGLLFKKAIPLFVMKQICSTL